MPHEIAIVAAHPDDEVIGLGGQLSSLRGALVVHVTDGAPRDMRDAIAAGLQSPDVYARKRREETHAALALAGIDPAQMISLSFADQEASLHLAPLATTLADLWRAVRPRLVFTHSYEGGHPDHDAVAFGVHAGCWLIEHDGGQSPQVLEFAAYRARQGKPGQPVYFKFLANGGPTATVLLNQECRELKRRMLDCFSTQKQVLKGFPLEVERLRPAPLYDFTKPPHLGRLYYENFPWGMTGPRWRTLAEEALKELGIRGPL